MFPSTQPSPDTPRRRVGDRLRDIAQQSRRDAEAGSTRLESLNPSLLRDLQRFAPSYHPDEGLDLLEVLAGALRHHSTVQVHLQDDQRMLTLAVLPARRLLRWALPAPPWQALRLAELRVLRVAATDAEGADVAAEGDHEFDLSRMLWELALHGARGALLPEIAEPATYRVTPGVNLELLAPTSPLAAAVQRLQGPTTPLREIAGWPGFDRDRAIRMLNALYLQSALIVTRSHPGHVPR